MFLGSLEEKGNEEDIEKIIGDTKRQTDSETEGTGQDRNQGEAVFEVKQNWSVS